MKKENTVASSEVAFGKKVDLFDLNTFMGRFYHFKKLNNPSNLFHSDESLLKYQQNIDSFIKTGSSS